MSGTQRTDNQPVLLVLFVMFAAVCIRQLRLYSPDLWLSPWRVTYDDGRHFVVWLRQMADPDLFPDDVIAEYFGALTPSLYKLMFQPAALLGIDIMYWHLLVIAPLGILLYFLAAERLLSLIFPDQKERTFAFLALVYMESGGLSMGLPKNFSGAIVFYTLYTFARGQRLPLAATMALGANLYPVAAITSGFGVGITSVISWIKDRRFNRRQLVTLIIAGAAGASGLGVFMLAVGDHGPTVSADVAQTLRIFQEGGRTEFFAASTWDMILCSKGRGAVLPRCSGGPGIVPLLLTIVVLGLGAAAIRFRRDQIVRTDVPLLTLFAGLLIASLSLYTISWLTLFEMHLPARYQTEGIGHLFRLSLVLIFVLTVSSLFGQMKWSLRPLVIGLALLLVLVTGFGPPEKIAFKRFERDKAPSLSAALRTMPKDTVVAGLAPETDSVPAFSGRSIYVGRELTVPYKITYYREMEQRTEVLATLMTGPVDAGWQTLLADSGIDMFLVGTPGTYQLDHWQNTFPAFDRITDETVFDRHPEVTEACTVAREGRLRLVDADCFSEKGIADRM